MSWNFKKVGTIAQAAALIAAVEKESAPEEVKKEVITRIEEYAGWERNKGKALFVETHGHLDGPERPYSGLDIMIIRVLVVDLEAPGA